MRRSALRDDQWDRIERDFAGPRRTCQRRRRRTIGCSPKTDRAAILDGTSPCAFGLARPRSRCSSLGVWQHDAKSAAGSMGERERGAWRALSTTSTC